MLDRPRFFPPNWRELLAAHAEKGRFNADERELLEAIVAGGERWGITPEEAQTLLGRERQRQRE